jgi:hypothetical protein
MGLKDVFFLSVRPIVLSLARSTMFSSTTLFSCLDANLAGTKNPVYVTLTIGGDSGATSARADMHVLVDPSVFEPRDG